MENRIKKRLLGENSIKILLHFVAWLILLGLPLYLIRRWHVGKDFIWLYYINTIITGIIFYVNYLALIPAFFFGSKRYRYYVSVVLLIGVFYFVSDISNKMVFRYAPDNTKNEQVARQREEFRRQTQPGMPGNGTAKPPFRAMHPPFREMHLFNFTFTSIFLVFFSLGLRILERQGEIEKAQKEMEKEKLNSELAFLKNQISPHFFFNTLNNIYSLTGINPQDSQKAILKLSKLMRYLLYESEKGNTTLSNEIDFMNNYIDLMKLRMSDKVRLEVVFPEENTDITIPPLLFIPFIENAFKHGISYRSNSFIMIGMEINDKKIKFTCRNSVVNGVGENGRIHSGIGLENVSKRLNLLFPGAHELKISRAENVFEVVLDIELS
jgi:two-component system, LytTR family, sensor kinase